MIIIRIDYKKSNKREISTSKTIYQTFNTHLRIIKINVWKIRIFLIKKELLR